MQSRGKTRSWEILKRMLSILWIIRKKNVLTKEGEQEDMAEEGK